MVMSLLHTHAPAGRIGEAVGVRMSLVQTSSVAVPLLFGAVGSSLGLAPVFWSVGVCLAAGGYLTRRGPAADGGWRRQPTGRLALQPLAEVLAELGDLGRDDDLAVRLPAVARRSTPGGSPPPGRTAPASAISVTIGSRQSFAGVELGDDGLGGRALLGRRAEDHRAVLRADVVALPVAAWSDRGS